MSAMSAAPPPESDPPLIVVTPDVARPGQVIELRYPTKILRGVPFVLSRWDDGQWSEPQFLLLSHRAWWANGPAWSARGSERWSWRDLGVGGPGPDRLKVPEIAEPGSYRICTANTGEKSYCVQLTISA
jgi:hypothetical protein